MLIDPAILPVFLLAVTLLLITPGPDMIFVLAHSLGGGRRAGIAAMLGVATGAWLHVLLAVLGLSALLGASTTAFNIVRFAGAAYLAYLGLRFLLAKGSALAVDPARARPVGAIWRQGMITNLLNPKAALFTLAFLPQFTAPELGPIWAQMMVLGLIIVAVMVLVDLPLVLAAGLVAQRLAARPRLGTLLGRAIGLMLIALAVLAAVARKPA